MVNKIENNEVRNKALFEARKKIIGKSDFTCLICGKKVSSFCQSHSVPVSCFNKMNLTNDKLCSHENICQSGVITQVFSGKSNSGIFKNICRNCDVNFFSVIDNMEVLKIKWTDEELRLQAIRILLYEIYRTEEFSFSFLDVNKKHMRDDELNFNVKGDYEKVNILKKEFYSLLNDNSNKFKVIYEKCLDYKCDFCCITLLSIHLTPVGNVIILPGNSEKIVGVTDESGQTIMHLNLYDKFGEYVYLVVLPADNGTKVLLYSGEKSIAGMWLDIEFNELSENEKMEKISAMLSIYGNNIHGNESFLSKFTHYKIFCQIVRATRETNEFLV